MLILIMVIAAILAAAIVLCGYTTFRLPVGREEKKQHIACVGDSVTYGCTLPFFFRHRYPAVLQQMMGEDVQVAAFGVNDRTLQNTGNKPFRKEHAFRQSKEFLPETIIILLGTNDSKDNNWISGEVFRQQYAELIAEQSFRSPFSNSGNFAVAAKQTIRFVLRFDRIKEFVSESEINAAIDKAIKMTTNLKH